MSATDPTLHHVVRNLTTKPVELHLPSGVVVVPPLGNVGCGEDDLKLGQVKALIRNGVLVSRATSAPQPRPSATKGRREAEGKARPREEREETGREPESARPSGGRSLSKMPKRATKTPLPGARGRPPS